MIEVKVTTIGMKGVTEKLSSADSVIRQTLRSELGKIGDEIVAAAQQGAPKRTGIMASKIIWFFGQRKMRGRGDQRRLTVVETKTGKGAEKINWSVMPTGRVAHLMERGVNATVTQRTGQRRRGTRGVPAVGPRTQAQSGGTTYQRRLVIAPRRFFEPAVMAQGSGPGVSARLQAALSAAAGGMNGP